MVNFQIRLIHKNTIVFSINNEFYYLKPGPDFPRLYNSSLEQQIVHNFDEWFQNKTHLRYSYQNVLDMSEAFFNGMNLVYTHDDLIDVSKSLVVRIINSLFQRSMILPYIRQYWIESSEPSKLKNVYGNTLRTKFEELKKTNLQQLYNNLCRMWQSCQNNSAESEIFENLIKRLNMAPNKPQYPNTDNLNNELKKLMIDEFIMKLPQYKIKSQLIDNINLLSQP